MATLLTVFNMSNPLDENGREILPDLEYVEEGVKWVAFA